MLAQCLTAFAYRETYPDTDPPMPTHEAEIGALAVAEWMSLVRAVLLGFAKANRKP